MPKSVSKKPKLTAEQRRVIREQPEPSAASLREIPELDVANARYFGRGPEGLRAALEYSRAKRGRPKKGEAAPGSTTKSLRMTAAEWAALERIAKKRGIALHALLRESLTETIRKAG